MLFLFRQPHSISQADGLESTTRDEVKAEGGRVYAWSGGTLRAQVGIVVWLPRSPREPSAKTNKAERTRNPSWVGGKGARCCRYCGPGAHDGAEAIEVRSVGVRETSSATLHLETGKSPGQGSMSGTKLGFIYTSFRKTLQNPHVLLSPPPSIMDGETIIAVTEGVSPPRPFGRKQSGQARSVRSALYTRGVAPCTVMITG